MAEKLKGHKLTKENIEEIGKLGKELVKYKKIESLMELGISEKWAKILIEE